MHPRSFFQPPRRTLAGHGASEAAPSEPHWNERICGSPTPRCPAHVRTGGAGSWRFSSYEWISFNFGPTVFLMPAAPRRWPGGGGRQGRARRWATQRPGQISPPRDHASGLGLDKHVEAAGRGRLPNRFGRDPEACGCQGEPPWNTEPGGLARTASRSRSWPRPRPPVWPTGRRQTRAGLGMGPGHLRPYGPFCRRRSWTSFSISALSGRGLRAAPGRRESSGAGFPRGRTGPFVLATDG